MARPPGIKEEQVRVRPLTEGSLNDKLSRLLMDDYLYVEARDPEHARVVQSRASMVSTYPASMAHMRFTAATYTAVGASAGDVRLLVRFQRVEDV